MWLIAGLGNPGSEYAATRHNIGFLAIERLAAECGNFSNKFHSDMAQATLGDEKCILLKPQTYMNHSGRAVQAAMAFYKLDPARLIVLHDELDLPLGTIRIKKAGGANGHNGIRDIDAMIGPDYWRVRLGIGHPGDKGQVHDYVLGRFSADEHTQADRVVTALAEHFPLFWQRSPEMLASTVATALNPPRPKPPKKEQEPHGL